MIYGSVAAVNVNTFQDMKKRGEKIAVLTAYDAPFARALDAAGTDVLLVGDSLGNVILGHENTLPVTMDDMIHHTKAVCRGAKQAFVIFDMPFMSYQASVEDAVRNAGRAVKETGCHAVKLEGGREFEPAIRAIIAAGIPVAGHLGLTPQSVRRMGGYVVQGKEPEQAKRIQEDAKIIEKAGVFMMVLECVPWPLARAITKSVGVPTIGIGAGPHCDGQVLVIHDILNMSGGRPPKFVKVYFDMEAALRKAAEQYVKDVREGVFPTMDHAFEANGAAVGKLEKKTGGKRSR